jgi:uncharacterized membrane protein
MMDHAANVHIPPVATPAPNPALIRGLRYLLIGGLTLFGLRFFLKDAVPYMLDFSGDQFGRFWDVRWWLVFHIGGGSVALLTGPFQFSTGLRRKNLKLHRRLGKLYMVAIAIGSVGAVYMGFTSAVTAAGAAYAFSLLMLAAAWLTTSGMALLMVKRRMIDLHKEWMIRSYVVTFAFVTFRWLFEMDSIKTLFGADAATTVMWACWVIPLGITEVVFHLRKSSKAMKIRAAKAAA